MRVDPMSSQEIVRFLERRRILRLALRDGDELYLVPLGYVWLDGALWCVSAEGKKTAMLQDTPRVAFQVDDSADTGLVGWTSVTGQGVAEIVADDDRVRAARRDLLERFADVEGADRLYADRRGRLVWIRIEPLHMSGRRSVLTPGT